MSGPSSGGTGGWQSRRVAPPAGLGVRLRRAVVVLAARRRGGVARRTARRRSTSGWRSRSSCRSPRSRRCSASPSAVTTASTPRRPSSSPARSCCRRCLRRRHSCSRLHVPQSAPRPLPVVHPASSTSRTTRSARSPRGSPSRRVGTDTATSASRRRPGGGRRLRRRQPCAARGDAAARPRPQLPRERPLLPHRPRDRVRARGSRGRRRCVRALQPVAPAGPDRAARTRTPLALDRGAAARERGALPDDVRSGADRDHAVRPRRQDHDRQPLGASRCSATPSRS